MGTAEREKSRKGIPSAAAQFRPKSLTRLQNSSRGEARISKCRSAAGASGSGADDENYSVLISMPYLAAVSRNF